MGPGFESLKVHQGLNTFFILLVYTRTHWRQQLNTQRLLNKQTVNLLFIGRTQRMMQYTATRYAVGPGFERLSCIVLARRLRKSSARVTPCFVGHRSKKNNTQLFFVR